MPTYDDENLARVGPRSLASVGWDRPQSGNAVLCGANFGARERR